MCVRLGCLQRPKLWIPCCWSWESQTDGCELRAGGCWKQNSGPREEQQVPTFYLSRLFSSFFPLKKVVCPTGKVSFFSFHGQPVGPPVCVATRWLVYV
ncbi:mCG142185 [Mus musculus]|nr:mCG142185 [Mus musculus]